MLASIACNSLADFLGDLKGLVKCDKGFAEVNADASGSGVMTLGGAGDRLGDLDGKRLTESVAG